MSSNESPDSPPAGAAEAVPAGAFRPVVLCFLFRHAAGRREVLLGLKKTGFGTGRIVALGGKLEPGETPAQAAVREVGEESGLLVTEDDLDFLGEVTWDFPANPGWNMRAWIYAADRFTGTAGPSEEITPRWYPASDPPWAGMWEDAGHWLPRVVAREPFTAEITLDARSVGVARAVVTSPAGAGGAVSDAPGPPAGS